MLDRPLVTNTNHHRVPSTNMVVDGLANSSNKMGARTRRNGSMKDFHKSGQEGDQNPKNFKNNKSLKYNPGALKAMLVEKLQKRYDLKPEVVAKRKSDKFDGINTQRNFRTSSMKNLKAGDQNRASSKNFTKRRRSRQPL